MSRLAGSLRATPSSLVHSRVCWPPSGCLFESRIPCRPALQFDAAWQAPLSTAGRISRLTPSLYSPIESLSGARTASPPASTPFSREAFLLMSSVVSGPCKLKNPLRVRCQSARHIELEAQVEVDVVDIVTGDTGTLATTILQKVWLCQGERCPSLAPAVPKRLGPSRRPPALSSGRDRPVRWPVTEEGHRPLQAHLELYRRLPF